MSLFKTEEKEKVKEEIVKEQDIEINKNEDKSKKATKEIEKKVSTRVFINLLIAILIMAYFCILSVVHRNVGDVNTIGVVKGATLVFLAIALLLIEIAYKKERKTVAINAFEVLDLATHILTTMHITKNYNFNFNNYI